MLRCFDDDNVIHVEGSVDPLRDAETVETELMLADLDSLERRVVAPQKSARGGDKEAKAQLGVMEPSLAALRAGKPARAPRSRRSDEERLQPLQLLTAKPVLYVCNVEEAARRHRQRTSRRKSPSARAEARAPRSVVISAAIEAEVAQLADADERARIPRDASASRRPGLDRVIRAGYALLDL